MKAAIVEQAGRLPAYGDFDEPTAGPGEVEVEVAASALSPLARGRASGAHYSATSSFPFVAGVDGVGRLRDGRRVYFLLPRSPHGAMAERTVVADGHWTLLPDGVNEAAAAVIANPGMSSWAALSERAQLRAGETVLVNGATGAAGAMAVRIARRLGAARVIATGRNRAVLDALGADAVVRLSPDEGALQAALQPHFVQGVNVVLDYLWGASARTILRVAAKSAPASAPVRFVQVGAASGAEMAMPAAALRSSPIEVKGSGLGSVALPRLLAAIDGVLRMAAENELTLDHRTVPLAEVADTWADEGRRIVYMPA